MLDAAIRSQLQTYLQKLQRPIELVASLDAGEPSVRMRELLTEIGALSDRIALRFDGSDERRPSFAVGVPGEPARIHFAGLPLGHEFTSLVLALLHTGGHPPKVEAKVLDAIRSISGSHRFETFVSLSCHNCPDVVQALNLMAAHNPGIEHVMIDGALFQAEVEARKIMAVPVVFQNGAEFGHGRMTLEEIVGRLDEAGAARTAADLSARAPYDILVVGGGPAGAAAAVYAARKGIRTGVVAERFGGQLLDTLGIENFISVQHTEGAKLAAALEQHARAYEVELITGQRAEAVVAAGENGLVSVQLASGATRLARSLVLAPGARWRQMNAPGEQEYRGRGVAYCPHCDGPLFRGKRVAVIGGGNSGVEAAIDLAGIVAQVTLIEFDHQLRADAVLQTKLRSLPNTTVIVGALTTEVRGDGQKVTGLVWRDRASGAEHPLALDGIFVQIGLLPNTEWLRDTVALSPRGEIEIDVRGQTSMPQVFAAGDATTVPFKQIVIAMGEGAKAALGAFDHLMRSPAPKASAPAEVAA